MRVPSDHNEALQMLRYAPGQLYVSHTDWVDFALHGGQRNMLLDYKYGYGDRLATVFSYLNRVTTGGGHTCFPMCANDVRNWVAHTYDCNTGCKSHTQFRAFSDVVQRVPHRPR